jgi:hypothetical protein
MEPSRPPLTVPELQDLLWRFAEHRVVTVAARVGVLERLAREPASAEEVAADLRLDPLATGKLVRALVAIGLLEAEGDRYRLPEGLAPHFAPGGAQSLEGALLHSHELYDRWGETLEPWVRGTPAARPARTPESTHRFAEAMASNARLLAPALADSVDLTGVERVLDVGGSTGATARALVAARPGLRATVLDLPEVAELGREAVRGTELEGLIEFRGGDYHEAELGEGYDLVLMASILHQELPEAARRLVARGAAALKPGTGRLAVVDFEIDEERRTHLHGALFAINMRSFGDVYTESTLKGWLSEAGLVDVWRGDVARGRWLVVGRRP